MSFLKYFKKHLSWISRCLALGCLASGLIISSCNCCEVDDDDEKEDFGPYPGGKTNKQSAKY